MAETVTADQFESLYKATAPDVFAYVRRRCPTDAEDVVAETFTIAWRRRDQMPHPDMRRAWLFAVARNLMFDAHRDRRRQDPRPEELAPASEQPGGPDSNRAREVNAAVARLRPAQREILRLSTWEGMSTAELAVVLNIRPATARVRLHRARRALAADPAVQALVEPSKQSATCRS